MTADVVRSSSWIEPASTQADGMVSRHTGAVLALVAGIAVLVGGLSNPSPVHGAAATDRLGGADRYETAAAMATATFPDGAASAVLARGDLFPDALAGAAYAGLVGGPILLTTPDRLPRATLDAVAELGATQVHILGAPGAVSQAVEDELRSQGIEVRRLAGVDRYETAAVVAKAIGRDDVGAFDGRRTVFIATGERFPDALSAGWAAYRGRHPVLLTRAGALPEATRDALLELAPDQAIIVGGPAAVAPDVASAVEALGVTVQRAGGRDRADTSAELANLYHHAADLSVARVVVARGDLFADALAVSPYAGRHGAPILLTDDQSVRYDVLQWVVDHAETIELVVAAGLTGAVSDAVLADIAAAAEPPSVEYTYEVGVAGAVTSDLESFAEHADWTLTDGRGWSLDHSVRFTRVASGGDFRLWIASPSVVAGAASYCSATWSCRVGDDVYINDERWRTATSTYAGRTLDDYRHYVVNHEVGHWLGLDHVGCPGPGQPAPVMQQQSIDLDACTSNVWPLPVERELVLDRRLSGAGVGEGEME